MELHVEGLATTTVRWARCAHRARRRRILTDPTFDPRAGKYAFGWGTSSTKTTGPAALTPVEIGPVDVVLLSHAHHADNLDERGRGLPCQLRSSAHDQGRGAQTRLEACRRTHRGRLHHPDRSAEGPLHVVATPCRHGRIGSRPIVGQVVGPDRHRGGTRAPMINREQAARRTAVDIRALRGDGLGSLGYAA